MAGLCDGVNSRRQLMLRSLAAGAAAQLRSAGAYVMKRTGMRVMPLTMSVRHAFWPAAVGRWNNVDGHARGDPYGGRRRHARR